MDDYVWKAIPQYPNYRVSDCGKVFSVRKSRMLKLQKTDKGYIRVQLRNGRGAKMFFVHRLVWVAFKGRIRKGYDIDHMNHIRSDNRLKNLQCITHKRNIKRMHKNSPHVLDNLKRSVSSVG